MPWTTFILLPDANGTANRSALGHGQDDTLPLIIIFSSIMREETPLKRNQPIHITFHNPNSVEDTAKYLTRLLAQSLAESVIRSGVAGKCDTEPPFAQHAAKVSI